jgi:hypothetical protein
MISPCCLCVCVSAPPITFWMPEPIFTKLGMYAMVREPISTAYLINPSHQSACLYMYPPYHCQATARYTRSRDNEKTWNDRRIGGSVYLWVCLWSSLPLLGNNSVKRFPRQDRIVGGVVLCAASVVSKQSRRLLLPRTSFCFICCSLMVWGRNVS